MEKDMEKNRKKMNAFRRFLCIPLSAIMLLAQAPIGAFAADDAVSGDADGKDAVIESEALVSDDADSAVSADEAETADKAEEADAAKAADEAAEEAPVAGEGEQNNIEINQGMSIHTGLNDGNETYKAATVNRTFTVYLFSKKVYLHTIQKVTN